jgi:ABC-type glycerol-3-phosphate transport system permease component
VSRDSRTKAGTETTSAGGGGWLPKLATYAVLLVGALVILGPFLWMVRSVVTPSDVLYSREGSGIIPRE